MLADADGAFTKDIGLDFTAPPVGLLARSKRYALYAEDGVVKTMHLEESPGVCEASGGESLLAAI
jgi:peroxiredoxin